MMLSGAVRGLVFVVAGAVGGCVGYGVSLSVATVCRRLRRPLGSGAWLGVERGVWLVSLQLGLVIWP